MEACATAEKYSMSYAYDKRSFKTVNGMEACATHSGRTMDATSKTSEFQNRKRYGGMRDLSRNFFHVNIPYLFISVSKP